jgi:hypothetical protein
VAHSRSMAAELACPQNRARFVGDPETILDVTSWNDMEKYRQLSRRLTPQT